jgi:Skp family chaperone for outer membrane proteins
MKRTTLGALLMIISVLGLAAVSLAQQAPQQGVKIAIINASTAFESSVEGKKVLTLMQEREAKIKGDLQKYDDSIRALQNRLSTGRLTMTNDALLALQADIDKKTTDRTRYQEDAAREANSFGQNLVNKVREEMVTIIQALRKERGYDVVLDLGTAGIVDYDPALDITDEVVRRYDASKAAAPPVKK